MDLIINKVYTFQDFRIDHKQSWLLSDKPAKMFCRIEILHLAMLNTITKLG
ncbi:MAG: hypothetical protein H6Q68_3913 [Firmicutes bacterium]|nr:hypothetical protein [Bacillota bacterium]